jgi:hypothetical protein
MKTFILPISIWLLACSGVVGTAGAREAALDAPVRSNWFASEQQAFWAACVYATGLGGSLVETTGTPSMEPLIRGKTYAVIKKCPFDAVVERDILVYRGRPDSSKVERVTMLHRAVLHDRKGWIMSGDNNRWSESWDRVTPENYIGTVIALFAFPNQ